MGLVDIGGTKCLASVTGDGGLPGTPLVRATPTAGDAGGFLSEMLDGVGGESVLEAIAVATPGPFDRERATLLNPPGLSEAWHGLDLRATLGRHFGCPVFAENDANCAALAEARFGAGRGFPTVAYYTVSTGIGAGVVRDGELVIARHDTEAGHQVLCPAPLGGWGCASAPSGSAEAGWSRPGRGSTRSCGGPSERASSSSLRRRSGGPSWATTGTAGAP